MTSQVITPEHRPLTVRYSQLHVQHDSIAARRRFDTSAFEPSNSDYAPTARRRQIREKYSLLEVPCSDCCVHLCCSSFGVCQEAHEAKKRDSDPVPAQNGVLPLSTAPWQQHMALYPGVTAHLVLRPELDKVSK